MPDLVSLQHIVGEADRLAQIRERVSNTFAEQARRHGLVNRRRRTKQILVKSVVEAEHGPIEPLIGIRNHLAVFQWCRGATHESRAGHEAKGQ